MPAIVERCVKGLMKDSDFEKTYQNRKRKEMRKKQLAWAICTAAQKKKKEHE